MLGVKTRCILVHLDSVAFGSPAGRSCSYHGGRFYVLYTHFHASGNTRNAIDSGFDDHDSKGTNLNKIEAIKDLRALEDLSRPLLG